MKVPFQVVALSSFLAASTCTVCAKDQGHLRRHLQFFGPGEDTNVQRPFDGLVADLTAGFEELFNMTAINQMDPLVVGERNQTYYGEDLFGITNCTGNITVTMHPTTLTGLSTVVMDRFELVQNTEQIDQANWWSQFLTWSATFDLLTSAESLSLHTAITIDPESDPDCVPLEVQSDDGSFTTGILVTITNPVLEMFLDMGGSTPSFFASFFGGESTADNISADKVSFTWDSWTVTFDNPGINQTINVTEVLESFDLFLSDSFNLTDFDITLDNLQNSTMEGLQNFGGFNGITDLIQEQTNVVSRSTGFTF